MIQNMYLSMNIIWFVSSNLFNSCLIYCKVNQVNNNIKVTFLSDIQSELFSSFELIINYVTA